MRKDRLAEYLLQSVTARERAVSTLGDLRETAVTRGEWWFWRNVIATAASLSWQALAGDPRGLFKLALRAWLVSLGLTVCVLLLGLAGLFLAGWLLGAVIVDGMSAAGGVSGIVLSITFLSLVSLCQFLVGRWIGRRAPGRKIAACLSFTMVQCAIEYTVVLALAPAGSTVGFLSLNFLTHIFCFAGALSVRALRT